MEILKEIYESTSQRIRSPFIGYIAISFIILNWKALFFLFFAEASVLERFEFFDQTTDNSSRILAPICLGVLLALLSPYLANLGSWWAQHPVSKKRLREINLAHQLASKKNELLAARDSERKILENALIEGAKVDQEVRDLDEEVQEEVQEKLGKIRDDFYSSVDALEGVDPIDPDGPADQLGDVISQMNANWQNLLHTRLSKNGKNGRFFGLVSSETENLPEVMNAIPRNRIYTQDNDNKRMVEKRLSKIVREGDVVLVSPNADLFKTTMDAMTTGGTTVVKLSG